MDAYKGKWHLAIEHRFIKTGLAVDKIIQDCTGDHIHDFRVEIKKLKAFIHLTGFAVADPKACRFPKPLNTLYKALGGLREWQIQKQNIVKAAGDLQYTNPLAYVHKIKRKTAACERKVMSLIQQIPDMKKMKHQIKNSGSDELSPVSIIRFIHANIQAVQLLVQSGKEDDESMHDIRKKIKDVQYVLSGITNTGETDGQTSPLASVQELSARLGDYHDLCVDLVLLKKELNTLPKKSAEKKLLRKIKDNWQAEKLNWRKQTLQATQALIGLHFSDALLN